MLDSDPEYPWQTSHHYHGVTPGDTFLVPGRKGKDLEVLVVECHHTVPTVGYLLQRITHKLKPEWTGRPGKEIGNARRAGQVVTALTKTPLFLFMGDTTEDSVAAALLQHPRVPV